MLCVHGGGCCPQMVIPVSQSVVVGMDRVKKSAPDTAAPVQCSQQTDLHCVQTSGRNSDKTMPRNEL